MDITSLILGFLFVLIYSFIASNATLFLFFCFGHPNKSGNAKSGRIFSKWGEILALKAKEKLKDDDFSFWKIVVCPICLNFYVTLCIYLIVWGLNILPFEFIHGVVYLVLSLFTSNYYVIRLMNKNYFF